MIRRVIPAGWRVLGAVDFRRLWLAHAGSVIGDGFHGIAVVWLVFDTLGGGPQALAVLGIATLVPTLALGIVSGTIVDRVERRLVMVTSDLIRAALVAALAVLVATSNASLVAVIAIAVLLSLVAQFFYPAQSASVPAYVERHDLLAANALMQATRQGAGLLVPAIGGVLFVAIGPVGLFAVDAVSFLWSAAMTARLSRPASAAVTAPKRPLLAEAADGLRFIASHAPSRLVVLTGSANQLFASGPFRTLVPAWVALVLDGGAPEYGVLMSALAAGLLTGSFAVSAMRRQLPLVRMIVAGVFVDGVVWAVFAFTPTLAIACVAFFVLGTSNAVLNASYSALIQSTVPAELRGRTFATFSTGLNVTVPISLAVTGALAATLGPVALIAASGLGLMLVGLGAFAASTRLGAPETATAQP